MRKDMAKSINTLSSDMRFRLTEEQSQSRTRIESHILVIENEETPRLY